MAEEAYEEEKNKINFVFKEPKFKSKRAKPPPNVLRRYNVVILEVHLWSSYQKKEIKQNLHKYGTTAIKLNIPTMESLPAQLGKLVTDMFDDSWPESLCVCSSSLKC